MDNHDLERRVAELEQRLARLEKREQQGWEKHDIRILDTELKVTNIAECLKEYDMVRTAAFGGYFATHPEVRKDLSNLEEILGTAPPDATKPPSEP